MVVERLHADTVIGRVMTTRAKSMKVIQAVEVQLSRSRAALCLSHAAPIMKVIGLRHRAVEVQLRRTAPIKQWIPMCLGSRVAIVT